MIEVRVKLEMVDRVSGRYIIDISCNGMPLGGTDVTFSNDPVECLPTVLQAEHDATCYLRGLNDGMMAMRNSLQFNNGMIGLMDAIRERHKAMGVL